MKYLYTISILFILIQQTAFCNEEITCKPLLNCPPDISLKCTEDAQNLNLVGYPKIEKDCGEKLTIKRNDSTTFSNCQYIVSSRTYTLTNDKGEVLDQCTQKITIHLDPAPLEDKLVTWPDDLTIFDCTDDIINFDLSSAGRPEIESQECNIYLSSIVDEKFHRKYCEDGYEINRTWRVWDWCSNKKIYHKQTIKVICPQKPTVECFDGLVNVTVSPACKTILTPEIFYAHGSDDDPCSLALSYTISIDDGPFTDQMFFDDGGQGYHSYVLKIENEAGLFTICKGDLFFEDKTGACHVDPDYGRFHTQPNITSEKNFSIFPNPAVEEINLEYKIAQQKIGHIKLYDLTGKTIKTFNNLSQSEIIRIQLSDLNTNAQIIIAEFFDGNESSTQKIFLTH